MKRHNGHCRQRSPGLVRFFPPPAIDWATDESGASREQTSLAPPRSASRHARGTIRKCGASESSREAGGGETHGRQASGRETGAREAYGQEGQGKKGKGEEDPLIRLLADQGGHIA